MASFNLIEDIRASSRPAPLVIQARFNASMYHRKFIHMKS